MNDKTQKFEVIDSMIITLPKLANALNEIIGAIPDEPDEIDQEVLKEIRRKSKIAISILESDLKTFNPEVLKKNNELVDIYTDYYKAVSLILRGFRKMQIYIEKREDEPSGEYVGGFVNDVYEATKQLLNLVDRLVSETGD